MGDLTSEKAVACALPLFKMMHSKIVELREGLRLTHNDKGIVRDADDIVTMADAIDGLLEAGDPE